MAAVQITWVASATRGNQNSFSGDIRGFRFPFLGLVSKISLQGGCADFALNTPHVRGMKAGETFFRLPQSRAFRAGVTASCKKRPPNEKHEAKTSPDSCTQSRHYPSRSTAHLTPDRQECEQL